MLYHIGPKGGCPLKAGGSNPRPVGDTSKRGQGDLVANDKPAVADSDPIQDTSAPDPGDRIVINLQLRPIKPRKKNARRTKPPEEKVRQTRPSEENTSRRRPKQTTIRESVSAKAENQQRVSVTYGYTGPKGTFACPFCVLEGNGVCVGGNQSEYRDNTGARRDGFEYVCVCSNVTDGHLRQFNTTSTVVNERTEFNGRSEFDRHVQYGHEELLLQEFDNDRVTPGADLSVKFLTEIILAAQHSGKRCVEMHGPTSRFRDLQGLSHGQAVAWGKTHLPKETAQARRHANLKCAWFHGKQSLISATRKMEHRDAESWWIRQLDLYVSMHSRVDSTGTAPRL